MATCKPKVNGNLIRFISVIRMGEQNISENISAEFITNDVLTSLPTQTTVKVTVDGNDYSYTYDLNNN